MDMNGWKAKQAAREAVAKAMHAAHPHLIPGKDCVVAAKNIRIELKAAFPSVKFSVKTRKYSGGDSIDVRWEDGPTTKMVDAIIQKYQGGYFDGMTDCYNYEQNAWTDAFGDAKFVFAHREYSDAFISRAIAYLQTKYPGNNIQANIQDFRMGKLYSVDCGFGRNVQELIFEALSKRAACVPS
jgi:hypothetical protein